MSCTGISIEYPVDVEVLSFLGAKDSNGYPMLSMHFDTARKSIGQAREQGGRVLVHCRHGKNRGAVIVTAYMIASERMPLLQAVDLVFQARPIVLSNSSFQRDLVRLATEEGLLTSC